MGSQQTQFTSVLGGFSAAGLGAMPVEGRQKRGQYFQTIFIVTPELIKLINDDVLPRIDKDKKNRFVKAVRVDNRHFFLVYNYNVDPELAIAPFVFALRQTLANLKDGSPAKFSTIKGSDGDSTPPGIHPRAHVMAVHSHTGTDQYE